MARRWPTAPSPPGTWDGSRDQSTSTSGASVAGAASARTRHRFTPVVPDQDLRDDVIVLTPPASFIANVSFWANASAANQIGVKMCNQTGGILAINSVTFRYVTIDAG